MHSPGHELLVEIQGEMDTPIRLVGRIQWAKKVPPTMMRISKGGMGIHIIRFDSGEEHYRQLCVKLGAA